MISMEWIGMAGVLAIEGSYVPQIVRLFRLKRADELSLFFPALNLAGRLLALSYSLLVRDQVFTVGFLLGALLRLTLLIQVIVYRRGPGRGDASLRALIREELAR